ncbi:MAG: hypothetical protein ACJAV6_000023 [Candidatus Paceibacteria bacterium]|jgi:hypothetical protein
MKKTLTQLLSGIITLALMGMYTPFAFAGAATELSDDMDRQKASTAASHDISFKLPSDLLNTETVTVTFTDFAGTAAATGANWTNPTANTVVYTATGTVTAGAAFTVTVDGLINPAAGNTIISILASNAAADSGEITAPIITDDQIQITAKVDQSLSFDVIDAGDTDNAVQFGSLTSGAIRYSTDTGTGSASETADGSSRFTAATNATGGYTISVEGDTLTSGANTITAIDGAAPTLGQEEFGLTIDAVSGTTGTITPTYTGVNYDLPAPATAEMVVTQGTAAATGTYGVNYVANIDGSTEAGNYSTAITYTMTANF